MGRFSELPITAKKVFMGVREIKSAESGGV